MILNLNEINKIIFTIKLSPEKWWLNSMSPGEYMESLAYVDYLLGSRAEVHLNILTEDMQFLIRQSLNRFLLDKYD